jgi:regulator of protease activity HflC (stomatin/prohibitin superfamily)/energy-coupling factor transporter ATP-binding protein EcfA2
MVQSPTRTNPFPGLRPFELGEEHLFFGREGQSDELLTRLNRTRFLAVVGTSGSGKSSLVRAGLLPSLYSGLMQNASSGWRVAIMRPGSAPMANLAAALNQEDVFGVDPASDDAIIRTALTESTLRRGALGLVEVTQQARMEPHENLLVVVDQFEELFRFKTQATQKPAAEDEAAAFVKLLLGAVNQRAVPIYVVLTMRSDFLGDCAQFRDLPETLNDSQYLIPRLTREQLKSAIEGPVAVGGATMTPRLVNRLLNDTGDNPDQLPILQHALMRAWDYWEDRSQSQHPIDIEHYEAIGGMNRALSLHADQIYFSFLDQESLKITETVFKRLTERGLNNREVRRPSSIEELCSVTKVDKEKIIQIIDQFRRHGVSFLMPPPNIEISEESIIDISQESLMRIWDRIQTWISEEIETAQAYRRLADTAKLHYEGKAALIRDPELSIAVNWKNKAIVDDNKYGENPAWAQRYSDNFDQVIEFIEKSENQKKTEEIARATTNRKRFFRIWIAIPLGLGILGLGIYVIGILAFPFSRSKLLKPTITIAGGISLASIGYALSSIRIINQGTEALVERLGRYHRKLRPGLNFIVPVMDVVVLRDSVREQILYVCKQGAITRDNVSVDVDVVMYWRILEIELVYYAIENVEQAIEELVITTLRSEIGKMEFEKIFALYDQLNKALLSQLGEATEHWGVKVRRVDVKEFSPPDDVKRSVSIQRGAELKRRVSILEAQGEYEAALLRQQAAELIADQETKANNDEAK